MLVVGLPSGLCTSESANSAIVSGVMTPCTVAGLHQLVVEPRELLATLGGEQLVDGVALVHA